MLYAASKTAPIDILAAGRRWSVDPGVTLTSSELPPFIEWERGEELAWQCWRHVVETMEPIMLEGPLPPRQGSVRPVRRQTEAQPIAA